MSDTGERTDIRTVIEDEDGDIHLRVSTTYGPDSETINTWCSRDIDVEGRVTFEVPFWLIDMEAVCIECAYQRRKATKERFEGIHGDE